MIPVPKSAFAAISLIMAVSCAFGFALRGILDKAIQEHREAKKWRWIEEFDADHDIWED